MGRSVLLLLFINLWAMENASLPLFQMPKAVTGPKINPGGNQIMKQQCFTQQLEGVEGGME